MVLGCCLAVTTAHADDPAVPTVLIDGCVPLDPGPLRQTLDWEVGRATQRFPEIVTRCTDTGVSMTYRRWEADPDALTRTVELSGATDEARRRWFVAAVVELTAAGRVEGAPVLGRGIVPLARVGTLRVLDLALVQRGFSADLRRQAPEAREKLRVPEVVATQTDAAEAEPPPDATVVAEVAATDDEAASEVKTAPGEVPEAIASRSDSGAEADAGIAGAAPLEPEFDGKHRVLLMAAMQGPGDLGAALGARATYEWLFSQRWSLRLGGSFVSAESGAFDLGIVDTQLYALDIGVAARTRWGPVQASAGAMGSLGFAVFTGFPGDTIVVEEGRDGEDEIFERSIQASDSLLPYTNLAGTLGLDLALSPSLSIRVGVELGFVTLTAAALVEDEGEVVIDGFWSRGNLGVGWTF